MLIVEKFSSPWIRPIDQSLPLTTTHPSPDHPFQAYRPEHIGGHLEDRITEEALTTLRKIRSSALHDVASQKCTSPSPQFRRLCHYVCNVFDQSSSSRHDWYWIKSRVSCLSFFCVLWGYLNDDKEAEAAMMKEMGEITFDKYMNYLLTGDVKFKYTEPCYSCGKANGKEASVDYFLIHVMWCCPFHFSWHVPFLHTHPATAEVLDALRTVWRIADWRSSRRSTQEAVLCSCRVNLHRSQQHRSQGCT